MAHHSGTRPNGRIVGLGAAAGALLILGVAPLTAAPPVKAEFFDDLLAPLLDGSALAAPAAFGTAAFDPTALFAQLVYTPLHTGIESWIDSDLGKQVDGLINMVFGSYVIGDGAAGTADNPTGGAGGWLFGDGGAGFNSTAAGVAGGAGGAAGWFGTGGAGGFGGEGAAGGAGGAGGWLLGVGGAGGDGGDGPSGGHGGDGGSATGLFGNGGAGGNAGDSAVAAGPHPLPALGGAGGNGSMWLGSHGAVGHSGTLAGASNIGASLFGTAGSWITDDDGRVVIMHGLNQVYKIAPYTPSADGFGDDDAAFLAANGFNAVRVGVIWAGVEPEPGVIDYNYLASVEQTVQTLARHGIVSILDMHQDLYGTPFGGEGAPDWAVQTGGLPNQNFGFPATYFLSPAENHAWDAFWSNAKAPDGVGLENHYAQMWQAVAGYFGDNPNVTGYEIMNEPWPGAPWLSSLLGGPYFEGQQLTSFYNQVDAAIRSVDSSTTVYFEPTTLFGSLPVQTHLGAVDDPNSVFSFHNYCITTSLIPSVSFGCDLNADIVMNNAQAYVDAHGIPGVMTEFGATTTLPTIVDAMRAADRHHFGWLEWAYTGNDITSASPNGQTLVFDPSKPPVGDNVDTAKLATLAAPYPQLVSGTPNSWSFDNGVFQFSYATERADGLGGFAAGSQTTISVPAIEYPNGYQVSVTGGHVVSAAGAPVLIIASDPGAGTVSVTVTAAGR